MFGSLVVFTQLLVYEFSLKNVVEIESVREEKNRLKLRLTDRKKIKSGLT